jgi:pimeloyl-ACP methyl ester carboxylesterase
VRKGPSVRTRGDRRDLGSATPTTPPIKPVVTLIHGTWSPRAPWVREGMPIPDAIHRAVPDAQLVTFDWSGKNSHRHRMSAADALRVHIEDVERREGSGVRHILVGHSHGATVALYALRDSETEKRVSGLVTLGAPFLRVRPRLDLTAEFMIYAATFACGMLVVTPMQLLARSVHWEKSWSFLLGILFILVNGGPRLFHLIESVRDKRIARIVADMAIPQLDHVPVLVVSALKDEAEEVLKVQRGVEERFYSLVEQTWLWRGLAIATVTLFVLSAHWRWEDLAEGAARFNLRPWAWPREAWSIIVALVVVLYLLAFVVFLLEQIFTLLLSAAAWIVAITTGWSPMSLGLAGPLDSWLVTISVVSYLSTGTEIANHELVAFESSRFSRFRPGQWSHSRIHSDPEVATTVAAWVNSTISQHRRTGFAP